MDVSGSSVSREKIAWGWDEKKEHKRYEPLRESTSFEPVPVPNSVEEAIQLVGRAELEGDPRMLAVLDRALAGFCTSDRRVSQLVQKEVQYRILRLDLPVTKSTFIQTVNQAAGRCFGASLPSAVVDDTDSPIRAFLWQDITERQWEEALGKLVGEEIATVQQEAEAFLKEWDQGEERALQRPQEKVGDWLKTFSPSQLLHYFFVFRTLGIEGVMKAQSVGLSLFAYLMQPTCYRKLEREELQEFRRLVVRDKTLLQKLPTIFCDLLLLRCKGQTGDRESLTASRFLLDAHSSYFSSLIDIEPTAREFDLSATSFRAKEMGLFLRWCMAGLGRVVGFEEDVQVKDLTQLLLLGAALGLINEGMFREVLQIEYQKRLSLDTLSEILQIAKKHRLPFLLGLSIRYINMHPSSNICLLLQKDGSYLLQQKLEIGLEDPPEPILRALAHIPDLRKASISTFRRQRRNRCTNFWAGLSRVTSRVLQAGERIYESSLGRLAKRVGIAAFSLWSVEQMAGVSWEHKRDFPIASGVAVVYPLIVQIHQFYRIARRHNRVSWNLPHLLPLSSQRTCLRTQEKVYGCFQRCRRRRATSPERGLIPSVNPLIEALPSQLHELSVVQAEDFTREDGLLVASRFSSLRQLEMGEHPLLEPEDWNFLSPLAPRLQTLMFTFERGQQPRGLNQVALHRFLEEGNLTVQISLFDTTAVYTPITFLPVVTDNMRVHLTLRHAPIPQCLIVFEAPPGYTQQIVGWPQLFPALRQSFPQIESFDCYAPIRDEDVEVLLPSLSHCTTFRMHQGTEQFTNAGLRRLAETCPLRELMLQMTDVDHEGLASLVEQGTPLEKISLLRGFHVTDPALDVLQRLSSLRECYLSHLDLITDRGVRSVLRSKTLQECVVYSCDGVSSQLTCALLRKSLTARETQRQAFQVAWKREVERAIPREIAAQTIPFLAIQAVIEIGKMILRAEGLAQLGIQRPRERENGRITFSMVEALARLYPERFPMAYWKSVFESMQKNPLKALSTDVTAFDPMEGKEWLLFGWGSITSISSEFFQQVGAIYKEYLQIAFPAGSVRVAEELSGQLKKEVETILQRNGGSLKRDAQECMPLLLMHAVGLRANVQSLRDAFSQEFFQEHITKVKLKGDELGWSDEQRLLTLFAPIFLHLDFWIQLFAPPSEELLLDMQEEKERKEEKKESKIREKEPQKKTKLEHITE